MSNITVVSTFHKAGYELYGKRFLESFAEKVESKIKLLVYAEGCKPDNPNPNQITIFDAFEALPKLNEFKSRWADVPHANGDITNHPARNGRKDWNKAFKWDAVRFANKVYAVFDACERSDDWCVWMDADTFVHTEWKHKQFKDLLPEDKWLTYVGRGKGSQTWPECGFYGMNLKHPMCKQFLAEFERFYQDANNGIFELAEWHDSFVFGHILNQLKPIDANVLDYSANMYLREARSGGGGHPLINGPLGQWIDHMKGNRKISGKSLKSDIMVKRTEEYWR